MALARQTPTLPSQQTAVEINSRWSGYIQLLLSRLREMKREPEVLFWVFAFPLLLALGLGIAFRNKPADITSVVILEGPRAKETLEMLERSPQHSTIHAAITNDVEALKSFRLGKYDLVITPNEN